MHEGAKLILGRIDRKMYSRSNIKPLLREFFMAITVLLVKRPPHLQGRTMLKLFLFTHKSILKFIVELVVEDLVQFIPKDSVNEPCTSFGNLPLTWVSASQH